MLKSICSDPSYFRAWTSKKASGNFTPFQKLERVRVKSMPLMMKSAEKFHHWIYPTWKKSSSHWTTRNYLFPRLKIKNIKNERGNFVFFWLVFCKFGKIYDVHSTSAFKKCLKLKQNWILCYWLKKACRKSTLNLVKKILSVWQKSFWEQLSILIKRKIVQKKGKWNLFIPNQMKRNESITGKCCFIFWVNGNMKTSDKEILRKRDFMNKSLAI